MIDPLGGAPFIEDLTDSLEASALELMQEIETRGGSVHAIEGGFMQREIHRSAMDWQRSVESKERVVVGVNAFEIQEPSPKIFRPDSSHKEAVLADLAAVRAERDDAKVAATLAELERRAQSSGNLMEAIVECADAYVTIGEICATLESVFGRYKAPQVL